ncbi:MAG: class I SAM-dependent methyltransferase [Planctomycetes bacterium]|nr:class I SAM-dependent methyltransferase [Planctomycetota bacterium]
MDRSSLLGLTHGRRAGAAARERAAEIAERLALPQIAADDPREGLHLRSDDSGLSLVWRRAGGLESALRVDLAGAAARRAGAGRGLPLVARALGLDRGVRVVVDATGGLGRDTATLAACGARVTVLERHPALAALLADGLRRLAEVAPELAAAITLVPTDAIPWLTRCAPADRPDAVLIDPMFPARRGSALPKLEMQVFRLLLGPGDAEDARALLAAARAACTRRAVVKRPAREGALVDGAVATLRGERARFDVYLPAAPVAGSGA